MTDAKDFKREHDLLLHLAIIAARANQARLSANDRFAVERLIREHAIVYFVWPGTMPGRSPGHELTVVKGAGLIRATLLAGRTMLADVTGVMFDDYEQAAAMQRALMTPPSPLRLISSRPAELDDNGQPESAA
jgi:hypothetical protein